MAAAGIAAAALFLWQISNVLLLAFGGILLAIGLRALGELVSRRTPLSPGWALWLTVLALALALVGLAWILGGRIAGQLDQLWQRLPETVESVRNTIQGSPLGQALPDLSRLGGGQANPLRQLGSVTSSTLGGLADLLLILVIGLYLAANPAPYRAGLVKLVPPAGRKRFDAALSAVGESLRMWLLGKAIAMLAVGVLTAAGLSVIGVPLALSLGVIAGLLDFVPFFGPIAAAVPGILIAFSNQPIDALYAALLYLGVQQAEGNLITPLVQRRTVDLQPVLLILGVVAFGVVFGFLGILFGAPLIVVAMVLVQKLYVEGALGDDAGEEGEGR